MKKFSLLAALMIVVLLGGCGSAFKNLKANADKGDSDSQVDIGLDYYYGTEEIKMNKELGLQYLEQSAEQNNSVGIFNIAIINQNNKNYKKALEYYIKATNNNYSPAYTNLALMYQNGYGVEKSIDKAIELFKLADENGDYLAKRNLAILYKKQKKYDKSEEAFKGTLLAPTYKKNSYGFKLMACLELMNMNYENKNYNRAYVWGGTAILAGLFDGKIDNEEEYLKRFNTIVNLVPKEEKKLLAKEILLNHYNMFEVYEYWFKKYPKIKSDDAVIMNAPLIKLIGYTIAMNKKTIQSMNYFKTKSDVNSKVSLAIGHLRLSSTYAKLGAIVPYFGRAITEINNAKKILDDLDKKNLVFLKESTNTKLLILEDVYQYQSEIHELKRAKRNKEKKEEKEG